MNNQRTAGHRATLVIMADQPGWTRVRTTRWECETSWGVLVVQQRGHHFAYGLDNDHGGLRGSLEEAQESALRWIRQRGERPPSRATSAA